jgi:hypothetical protein
MGRRPVALDMTQKQEDLFVKKYLVLHPHRLHLDPTAAPTLVPLVILAVLVVVVRPVRPAVITRAVVRRGQSAGEYVYPS